jgi:hypothetical protein
MQTIDFVALYRGTTVAEARLVAVTAEPGVVEQVLRALIGEDGPDETYRLGVRHPLTSVTNAADD